MHYNFANLINIKDDRMVRIYRVRVLYSELMGRKIADCSLTGVMFKEVQFSGDMKGLYGKFL